MDSLLVSLAWYLIISHFGHANGAGVSHAALTSGKTLTGIPALVLLAGTAIFWILPEWLLGATIGKLLVGLRIVSTDGSHITLAQSLQRNTLRLIDFFPFYLTGFLTAALTPNRQRLGDLWARTIVVQHHALRPVNT
jgi:uncharacterized RDD family membrane protein YckC